MKKELMLLFLGLLVINIKAQNPSYDIKLKLDTLKNTLNVQAHLKVDNKLVPNSDTIWFHLPFNAFVKYGPFAEEQLKGKMTQFHFRRASEYVDMRDFTLKEGSAAVTHFFKDENKEFVGLLASKNHEYTFNYTIVLPKMVNGLGYDDGNYWLRNFYPQLCQYDGQWILQPYTQYIPTTYRKADIKVTLEDVSTEIFSSGSVNYIGSDAVIEAKNTKDFALQMISTSNKTEKGVFISGTQTIPYTIFFLGKYNDQKWVNIHKNLQSAVKRLTQVFGEYPHKSLTININTTCVTCFLASGLLQIKDNDDDNLEEHLLGILSEVWIEALVDTDLNKYWLGDGLSSYYYDRIYEEFLADSIYHKKHEYGINESEMLNEFAKLRKLMPLNTPISNLNGKQQHINLNEFSKAFFKYTENLVGKEILDKVVKSFSESGKTLNYENLVADLEDGSGKQLRPALDAYIQNASKTDYEIKSTDWQNNEYQVKIVNHDTLRLPFLLSFIRNDGSREEFVVPGFQGEKNINVDIKDIENISIITIDRYGALVERNRANNHYFPNGVKNRNPFKLNFFFTDDDSKYQKLLMALYPAYNSNDGWMLGSLLSNSNYDIIKDLSFAVAPMYSFNNKKVIGQAWINYDKYISNKNFDLITTRIGLKSFHMDYNKKFDYYLRYIKIDPSVTVRFRHSLASNVTSSLHLQAFLISEQSAEFVSANELKGIKNDRFTIFKLDYDLKKHTTLSTSSAKVSAEHQTYDYGNYTKLSTMIDQRWMYRPRRNFYFRVFASGFLANSQRQSLSYQNLFTRGSIALIQQGFNDYTYDEYFLSRQNQNLLYDDQVSLVNGGGFKTPIGSTISYGMSNNFAASLNSSVDLPFGKSYMPFRIYFDLGTFSTYNGAKFVNNWMYNGGISLNLNDIVAIHCPLVFSEELGNFYKSHHKTFLSRLSFMLNLDKINFWNREISDLTNK